jgi:hypothetical protein
MNAISFGSRKLPGAAPAEPTPDAPVDAAWIVLEAANDLGDTATIEACRRVIDANLNGRPASTADLYIVTEYFR